LSPHAKANTPVTENQAQRVTRAHCMYAQFSN
jgi:hypothetical protein